MDLMSTIKGSNLEHYFPKGWDLKKSMNAAHMTLQKCWKDNRSGIKNLNRLLQKISPNSML